MAKITIDQLVELAFAVEEGDPFDWNSFKQGKEQAMKMIAASILDQFDKEEVTDRDHIIMLATITKLVTENMILHTQLMQAKK